jgi:tetratricopeptide (TPR) repeat protein
MFKAFCLSLLLAVPALAAAGGGSFPSTVGPSGDADLEADYAKAEYLIKSDNCAEAIPLLKKVVVRDKKHTDALNYLGYCHRKMGKLEEAMEYYERALKIDPKHRGALEYLGELYLLKKDLPKAEEQLAKLKALCPTGCTQLEDLEDAIAAYKRDNP